MKGNRNADILKPRVTHKDNVSDYTKQAILYGCTPCLWWMQNCKKGTDQAREGRARWDQRLGIERQDWRGLLSGETMEILFVSWGIFWIGQDILCLEIGRVWGLQSVQLQDAGRIKRHRIMTCQGETLQYSSLLERDETATGIWTLGLLLRIELWVLALWHKWANSVHTMTMGLGFRLDSTVQCLTKRPTLNWSIALSPSKPVFSV